MERADEMAPRGRRVLVVDDDPHIRMFLRLNFTLEGFEVREAEDGIACLAEIATRRPDLIILDVMMPRLDGFGVLAALRSNAETRDIPCVLLTAKASDEAEALGMAAGASAYRTKPFDPVELIRFATGLVEVPQS